MPNEVYIIHSVFYIIFRYSPRCEMEFDVLRNVSLKQVHKYATQTYFV